jgi:hypothetical protein
LLVAAYVVPSSPILVTLMKEAVLTRATRRNIPEDTIQHIFVLLMISEHCQTCIYIARLEIFTAGTMKDV